MYPCPRVDNYLAGEHVRNSARHVLGAYSLLVICGSFVVTVFGARGQMEGRALFILLYIRIWCFGYPRQCMRTLTFIWYLPVLTANNEQPFELFENVLDVIDPMSS
jgi:energy-coupling factor transporter transmembrane protein EcfT